MDTNYHENGFNNSCLYTKIETTVFQCYMKMYIRLYIYNIYIFTMSDGALIDEHIVTISIFL